MLVVRIDELKLIAERVVDLPDLYDRLCRQLRAFDTFEDLDETPAHVLLENVDGIMVVSAITFRENVAADRFWARSKADVRL